MQDAAVQGGFLVRLTLRPSPGDAAMFCIYEIMFLCFLDVIDGSWKIIKLLPLLYVWYNLDLILITFSNIILGLGEDIRAITVSDLVLGSLSNVNNKFKKNHKNSRSALKHFLSSGVWMVRQIMRHFYVSVPLLYLLYKLKPYLKHISKCAIGNAEIVSDA